MSITELHVVEWSPTQGAFHRHTLGEMIQANIAAFRRKVRTDYIPIGVFEKEEEVEAFLRKAQEYV